MAETTELMKRPTKSDDIVLKRTMELFMPKVISYLGTDFDEHERHHVEKQIMRVLPKEDGYAMARALEHDGWEEDRALMDLMDDGEHFLRKAHEEILSQWIRTYGITACREIGTPVTTSHWRRKGQVGTIAKIYPERAEYGVHFPDQPQTSWQILKFEEVLDVA